MIKIENVVTPSPEQWEAIIMGTRNPMNSWDRSDTMIYEHELEDWPHERVKTFNGLGGNDYDLMMRLSKGGPVHAKYRRMIMVYVTITAPLYWWKEFDTYKVGTVTNSCSTMHKVHAKEFTLEDFSHEHLFTQGQDSLESTINNLNYWRNLYLNGGSIMKSAYSSSIEIRPKDKTVWWQMIQLLPSSYNQKRTVMLNYEVLAGLYPMRKNHKLDEWREFCDWIETLPYSEIITGKSESEEE